VLKTVAEKKGGKQRSAYTEYCSKIHFLSICSYGVLW